MSFSYQTIKKPVTEVVYKDKGSKFVGFGVPVCNEEEFKIALEKIKTSHPKATHHCYAYRFGISGEEYRANDDGEPSGSAGLPIYNQLLAHEVSDILVVVVRYYGGTKLGVAGLIKAYKETSKLVLEEAKISIKILESRLMIEFPYSEQHLIFTLLNKFDAKILEFNTEKSCTISASIATEKLKSISEKLSEMQYIVFEIS
ncbi:IMPACT family protein [Frigoriflavimonas asaccharolytica]|uniref:Putative YigZ family protein n=1 Tax=Frigoriflavimonas asaccharolytica TaxID=2735899 RepID=A0A8J8G7L5_9FLAO|nr:YigZ family protein [Frigoriflavimonas asaccharolytica]NRS92451.1 putative YigZ family protein [Frigoriflavimonas asaccharolytica]